MLALDQFSIQSLFSDERNLFVPDISATVWEDLDYFGWIHPDGKSGFIALESPNDGRIKGVKLQRQNNRQNKPKMCSWCHFVHKNDGTAFFSVEVKGSQGRRNLGNLLCKDLDCSSRVRNPKYSDSLMQEVIYQPARIWRLKLAMHRWLGKANLI
mgnify:FL=1